MIIVLEGLEGVGKTSLAEMISPILNARYLKTPPKEFNPIRGYVAGKSDKYANFYFYLSGLLLLQEELKQFKGNRDCVVIDRYLHSTIAYHDKGESFSPPNYENMQLIAADLTIHVTCAEMERQQRKQARGFHLFDRVESNERKIVEYFRRVSDFEFCNSQELTRSARNLSDQTIHWLSKNINTFGQQ